VCPVDDPSLPLSFVVVPTDRGNQFALEGPDPAKQHAWTRRPLTREQIKSANTFVSARNPKVDVDLFTLSLFAETWRFVWAVACHDKDKGTSDYSHHATLESARRRFEKLASSMRRDTSRTWPVQVSDVFASVHRVAN